MCTGVLKNPFSNWLSNSLWPLCVLVLDNVDLCSVFISGPPPIRTRYRGSGHFHPQTGSFIRHWRLSVDDNATQYEVSQHSHIKSAVCCVWIDERDIVSV